MPDWGCKVTEPVPLVPWLLPLLGHGVQTLAPLELLRPSMPALGKEMSGFGIGRGEVGRTYPVVDGGLRRHPGLPDSVTMSGGYGCMERRCRVLLVWLVEPENGGSFRERRRCFQEGAEICPFVSAGRIDSIRR